MSRHIHQRLGAQPVIRQPGIDVIRALPQGPVQSVGPFVFLDHFSHSKKPGIGDQPHPHAGIEVFSYLLDGHVKHRDSMGGQGQLGAGEAQWIKAGRGLLHAETPAERGHGLQLWTALPARHKQDTPEYAIFNRDQIAEHSEPGATLKVISGQVNDLTGPARPVSPTVLAHLSLKPNATFTLQVNPADQLALYVLSGQLATPDTLKTGELGLLDAGDQIKVTAGPEGAEVALLGGEPVSEPLFFSGPFVMNDAAGIRLAQQNYLTGKMGTLDGVPF